jgi:hypothetical protein
MSTVAHCTFCARDVYVTSEQGPAEEQLFCPVCSTPLVVEAREDVSEGP